MIVGIASENREKSEKRVIFLPCHVNLLVKQGNTVKVEKEAGNKLGISDEEYKKVGAVITSKKEAYQSDVVLRIRVVSAEELNLMKRNSLLVSMVHSDTHPELIKEFKLRKINVLELNEIKDSDGKRLIEAFDISANEGIRAGFSLYNQLYRRNPHVITIMGCGNLAMPAIKSACRLGAVVKVLGRKQTEKKQILQNLKGSDVLINATYRTPEEIGKLLVKKEDLLFLNKDSLILDFSADPISCIETCHPTNLDNPYYFVNVGLRKIPHMCIYSLPGLNPLECSKRYDKQIFPFLEIICKKGLKRAIDETSSIKGAFLRFGNL